MRRVLGLLGMLGLVLVGFTNVGNTPPMPVVEVHPTSGEAPLFVESDASQSFDPDGKPLFFSRNFGDEMRACLRPYRSKCQSFSSFGEGRGEGEGRDQDFETSPPTLDILFGLR